MGSAARAGTRDAQVAAVTAEIDAAVKDYRTIFPEPHALAPNLELAVRAAGLLQETPVLSREELIELIPAPRASESPNDWPADERELFYDLDWAQYPHLHTQRLDRLRREKVADAILAALGAEADTPTREAHP